MSGRRDAAARCASPTSPPEPTHMSPDRPLLPIMLSNGGRFAVLRFSDAYLGHAAMPTETGVCAEVPSWWPTSSSDEHLSVGPYMCWCPLCLDERPYHRRMWHHRQLQACPHHRVVLSDRCAGCVEEGHVGVTWWTSVGVAKCAAGHALERQAPGENVADCTGAAAVYRACGVSCPGAELPPDFAALSAANLVESLLALGRLKLIVVFQPHRSPRP